MKRLNSSWSRQGLSSPKVGGCRKGRREGRKEKNQRLKRKKNGCLDGKGLILYVESPDPPQRYALCLPAQQLFDSRFVYMSGSCRFLREVSNLEASRLLNDFFPSAPYYIASQSELLKI